jgi:hypothetical protein
MTLAECQWSDAALLGVVRALPGLIALDLRSVIHVDQSHSHW